MTQTLSTPTPLAQQLWFAQPGVAEIRAARLQPPHHDEVLVQVECSAVSAGTELLVYRGQVPADMALDSSIAGLQQATTYPLRYGYACVGRVTVLGDAVDPIWQNKRVFVFAPHASHLLCRVNTLLPIPDDISDEDAVFFPNMETAVNLIQDGAPRLGEKIVVIGQGVVGLLLTRALSLAAALTPVFALDQADARRTCARQIGIPVFDPQSAQERAALQQLLSHADGTTGADLIFEVTGNPHALNLAIELSGFASRIVIGSWYGTKTAAIALGGHAHRNRLQIITSQVSTLAPELTGRWTQQRRADLVWQALRLIQPRQFITHRTAFNNAPALYDQLHSAPDAIMQAIFTYS